MVSRIRLPAAMPMPTDPTPQSHKTTKTWDLPDSRRALTMSRRPSRIAITRTDSISSVSKCFSPFSTRTLRVTLLSSGTHSFLKRGVDESQVAGLHGVYQLDVGRGVRHGLVVGWRLCFSWWVLCKGRLG